MISRYSPGKIILFGEYSVVFGGHALSGAISIGTRATVRLSDRYVIENFGERKEYTKLEEKRESRNYPIVMLLKKMEKLYHMEPVEIKINSDLKKGLGSSSSTFSSVLRALNELFNLKMKKDEIFDLVQYADSFIHGKPSGVDAYTVLNGGFCLFRKNFVRR